jgi:ATP phosphoribosyltransferase
MLVRDDDIPAYVADGICHLGIVGQNVANEKHLNDPTKDPTAIQTLLSLGFGGCRLSLAVPEEMDYTGPSRLNGLKIATSYPNCLKKFLNQFGVEAQIVKLSGSVEIAPGLKIADAICDLVSTGGTLKSNGLKEVTSVLESEAVLIRTSQLLSASLIEDLERLMQRIQGVVYAAQSKYIMMNAPRDSLNQIRSILPGMEEPSVIPLGPLGLNSDRIAIHAVAREPLFWETIESLKAVGATSILVLAIEKVIQ